MKVKWKNCVAFDKKIFIRLSMTHSYISFCLFFQFISCDISMLKKWHLNFKCTLTLHTFHPVMIGYEKLLFFISDSTIWVIDKILLSLYHLNWNDCVCFYLFECAIKLILMDVVYLCSRMILWARSKMCHNIGDDSIWKHNFFFIKIFIIKRGSTGYLRIAF